MGFFCSGVQFCLLLSPYVCFISFFIYWLVCSVGWCVGGLGVFHANQTSVCIDPHLD